MIFWILYSRSSQNLRDFRSFPDEAEDAAQEHRLQGELNADPSDAIESLLIRADSEEQVRESHARYFENAADLLRDLRRVG